MASLEDQLREGAKQLVGNREHRRYLRVEKGAVSIDPQKTAGEARYDGKFVLRTNTNLPASEVGVQYELLLLVEQFFRATKSLVETRPIFHQWNATIRGHAFSSFLALVLMLQRRLAAKGWKLERENIRQDLEALGEVEVGDGRQRQLLRADVLGVTGKVLQGVGAAIAPPARLMQDVVPKT